MAKVRVWLRIDIIQKCEGVECNLSAPNRNGYNENGQLNFHKGFVLEKLRVIELLQVMFHVSYSDYLEKS